MAEKEKGCQAEMLCNNIVTSCGRKLYDEANCIFHSKRHDKDVKLFRQELDELFKDSSLEVYDFKGFVFPEGMLFPEKIDKQIVFRDVVFQGIAVFIGKTFQEKAFFIDTTFHGMALFDGASFQDEAYFRRVTFQENALFVYTTFKCIAYFDEITFEKKVGFDWSSFEDALIVNEEHNNKIFSKKEVDFGYVRFLKPEKVAFRKVDLGKFRFLGTDLRKVEFVDVDWDREKGRNRIYDEVSPETTLPDYPLIAQVYKRLRANYEENLNYAEAGDFHIGEMEMRRKGEKNPFNKGIICLYKLLSNYGESYWHPLAWILLFLFLLFPIVFMCSGIEGITQSQNSYLINYDFDVNSISLNKEKVGDYLKSFVYSLSVFSLVREKQYRPIDNCGHFWMVLESILSPVLIAFFLLALRRRFRR